MLREPCEKDQPKYTARKENHFSGGVSNSSVFFIKNEINTIHNTMCILCTDCKITTINLEITDCPNLQSVYWIPSVKYLSIHNCPELKYITDLPNLLSIECTDCPKLYRISSLPIVQSIRTHNCISLSSIDVGHDLVDLSIADSAIVDIPNLDELRYLDCSRTAITSISGGYNLQTLQCIDCLCLQTIEYTTGLYELNCSGSSIEVIEGFEDLVELICRRCKMLTSIRDVPDCRFIDYRDCPKLQVIDLPESTRIAED